ncbi:MAG: DJ-1/PfpI family protein [Dokdonella sp.]|uniref:DJ-1/PfpI family protein n=1 Tax=Dokdonella sp. TaxID=2291710 RepID=UPI0032679790
MAFAINPGVQVIDLAGPWETFQDTYATSDAQDSAFTLFTVCENIGPVRASGGLMLVPDYSTADAPQPDVIVVPHFDQPNPASRMTSDIHAWIRHAHEQAALTMSVCTGAFQLAKTGLLDGIPMTTNKLASDNFARSFPEVDLRRGPRFVESGRIATSGGLSAGIDLALRVVSRYFDESVATQTAMRMEYAGTGWRD